MTTRSRPRARPGGAKTYTARLYQRAAAPKPKRQWPTRHLPALLVVVAEAGHLIAALIEWPGAPARGLFHVLAAAGLGLLAATIYFGHSRVEPILGAAFTVTVPVIWLVGALLGLSIYREFPPLAAVAMSAVEFGTAALLAVHARSTH